MSKESTDISTELRLMAIELSIKSWEGYDEISSKDILTRAKFFTDFLESGELPEIGEDDV